MNTIKNNRIITGIGNVFGQYRGLRRENYVLFFGNIVTCMGSMIWPMLTFILDQRMGMSAGNIALLFLIESVICMPASLLGGKLADKMNKKIIIIFGDSVSVICFLICGFIPLSYITIALILVASFFQGVEGPAYDALVSDITPTKDREKAFSLLYLGANIGLMISPTISGFLFKNYLWLAFVISAVAIGCSTILIAILVRDIEPIKEECEEAVYQKSRENESVWRVLLDNKPVLLFTVIMSLYYAAYNQFYFLMPIEMGNIHGEDGALIYGTVTSVNCIIVVIFTPLITNWFKKMYETGKIVMAVSLTIVGFIVFIAFRGKIPIYYISVILFTWGEVFGTLAQGPYESKRIPSSHRGRLISMLNVASSILLSLFKVGVGKVYDYSGSLGAWIIVIFTAVLALALAVRLIKVDKRYYPKLYADCEKDADTIE